MSYFRTVDPDDSALLTLDQIKEQCRISHDADDDLLEVLRQSARELCEDYTGRSLMPQTWQRRMDGFPCARVLRLRYPPLAAVTSIQYIAPDGTLETMPGSDYVVDVAGYRGRVALAPGASWPATQAARIDSVTITYVAGHADTDAVPMRLKQGLLMLINHHYDTRTPIVIGTIAAEVDWTLRALWAPMRVTDRDED